MPAGDSNEAVLYVVDGSSYLYRSFFAVRGLRNREGFPTNAVFGFANMINRILKERNPRYMAIAFDAEGPTFRHEQYPEYKAKRDVIPEDLVAQIPCVKRLLTSLGIPMLEKEGFEADDIIGTLCRKAKEEGFHVVVVGSDKDFFQLLSDRVVMWDTMKNHNVTAEDVEQRFGVPPSRILEVMSLMGDTSDNIPGIPGVGEKTAVKLIHRFGDLETLLEHAGEVKAARVRKSLMENGEQARVARELMTIRTDVPLDVSLKDLEVGTPDVKALANLYRKLDFQKFLEELDTPGKEERTGNYRPVTRLDDLRDLVHRFESVPLLALDTETTSQDPMRAALVGISLCAAPFEAYYIPVGHSAAVVPEQIPLREALECLRPLLESPTPLKVGHNIKYDLVVLAREGLHLQGIGFDTMVASYLLDPERHSHSLTNVGWEFLGERVESYKEVVGTGRAEVTFDLVPLDRACPYAAEDADVSFRLYHTLREKLAAKSLDRLMDKVEVPLIGVLAAMEMRGVKVDRERLDELSKQLSLRLLDIEQRIYTMAGKRFNLNSPKQLEQVLFQEMGLTPVKKTQKKSGFSTDMEVLTILARSEPVAQEILNYRVLSKLKSTYVDTLPKLIHPETGRVHTSFNQTVTATGRLSSSNPNLQNIPARGEEGREIRKAFVPEKGCKFVSADYSQIELRILAHYSRDPVLTQAFERGEDIHTQTACGMFGVAPHEVTPDMRRQAKVINFGIIYGMRAFGLARQLGVSRREAQEYIDRYFERFAGVREFIERNLEEARTRGYVTTILDRRRYLPHLRSKNNAQRTNAERIATNTPIQGSAADIIKMAMIRLERLVEEQGLGARMLLQVHDELLFEVPEREVEQLLPMIRREMEGAIRLHVPLVVDVQVGDNWAEAH